MSDQDSTVPSGYCHCGCGQKTNLASKTDPSTSRIKGEPMRYLKGHWTRGRPRPANSGRKRKHRYCEHCGILFFNPRPKRFCSVQCRYAAVPTWNKGRRGYEVPGAHRRVERTCLACGGIFYVYPKSERPGKYCSSECYLTTRWPNNRITRACAICGRIFESTLSANRVSCSERCRRERISEALRGPNSHLWRGGKMAPYNSEWQAQRRAALERDNHTCVLCGDKDGPQVHHITPYRYSQSHATENLVTLCRSCHSREELKVNAAVRAGLLARWPKS